ncbi:MAG: diacylglycerol kinase family protein [Anaerolineae bacterium]|nr:diacylglycerol kinase family protein [Anaerolineae bacterium]
MSQPLLPEDRAEALKWLVVSRAFSFKYAFEGVWHLLRTQPNAWIHAAVTILVIPLGVFLRLGPLQWALLVLAAGMVWSAELLNTAIEAVIDLVSPDTHRLAKIGKDTAAAGVLATAFTAVLVGLLVLGPPLFARLIDLLVPV